MGKLNLAAMSYEKDAVLNALQKTGATEVKLHSETEYAVPLKADCEELRAILSRAENALGTLTAEVGSYFKEAKLKTELLDEVEISYSEFIGAKERAAQAEELIEKIEAATDRQRENFSELSKLRRRISSAEIYSGVKQPLKTENTAHARFRFGSVPAANREILKAALAKVELSAYSYISENAESALVLVASHKSQSGETDAALQEAGFAECPFSGEQTGEELYNSLKQREEELVLGLRKNKAEWAELGESIRELKIYCEYLAFELEKAELNEKLRATQTAFLLEAYVPKDAEELVSKALRGVSDAVYFEFSEPSPDETPPTLLKNNKVVKNFEAITNLYSPPASREFDPNTVMAFFYSLFLGFIMADIGYGLLMILGGSFIYIKSKRDTMFKRLGGVFAAGGIFTVIWGALFNSFFGFALLPFKVMPDLQGENMSWALAGINVPALLVISMLIGVIQLCAGYICRTVQCWRRGEILDGIFDGLVWALFSVGVELAIIGFIEQFKVPVLATVGGIIAGVSLLVAILTAGRKEKLLGKFTKGFGSAYGVINYASDILSYARLYGLMLAGAVIADIISSNSVSLISSGNFAFIILGILIMLIGHVFNLAIGLLGAYIHDARLQYVEFYGRFYEGEGKLFTPLGSVRKHVFVKD